MTIFQCKSCQPERPCFFDNNSTDDDVAPGHCPIEGYEHAEWEKKNPCKYCESSLEHEPNSRYCGQCGSSINDDLPPNICVVCGDFGDHCERTCGIKPTDL